MNCILQIETYLPELMRATVAEPQSRQLSGERQRLKEAGGNPSTVGTRTGSESRKRSGAASQLGMAKPNAHQGAPGRARQPEGTDAVLTWGDLGTERSREVSRGHSTLRAPGIRQARRKERAIARSLWVIHHWGHSLLGQPPYARSSTPTFDIKSPLPNFM